MLRLLASKIFGFSARCTDDPWAPIIEAAIEKAVDATDPRLRALYCYREKLRQPVTCAVRFVHELGEWLPPPAEMSRAAFASQSSAKSFFSSAARLQEVFSTSLEVEAFMQDPEHRTLGEFYSVLAMTPSERQVLAPVLEGEQVQRDVKRTLVSFDDHRVVLPSPDEANLRRQFKERAFTTLLECALARMAARRDRKEELKKRRALLRAKLHAIRSSRSGLDTLSGPVSRRTNTADMERKLEQAERELHAEDVSGDALERSVADLSMTLSQPGEFIDMQRATRRLTAMGFLSCGDDVEPESEVEFVQVSICGRPGVCGVLTRYPAAELRPVEFYRDRMRRALNSRC